MKQIFLSPPWIGEEERRAVARAFDSGYVAPCGPDVEAFEAALAKQAGRRYAVAVSSGTAALDLAMAELGVDASWTVFAPTLTFIATVGPAFHRGAKLVFIDSDATANLDVALLENALRDARRRSKKAKLLVIGVDLYGRCCDRVALESLCQTYQAKFVMDAAESVGATDARGRPSGAAGLMAVYSFNGNKIITTSGGGALLTDDPDIAARARKRSQQSREPVAWYEHQEVGYNYRLSNLLAAVGRAQLKKLPRILKARRANYLMYRKVLDVLPEVPGENHWLTVALLPTTSARDELLARFASKNIEARPVWKPLHLQPVFASCPVYGGEVAEAFFAAGVCLPSGTGLTAHDRKILNFSLQR